MFIDLHDASGKISAATVHSRLIVWCRDCSTRFELDPAEMAERYGAETTVPNWAARLVYGQCGSHRGQYSAMRISASAW
jgi:hypothetical protein